MRLEPTIQKIELGIESLNYNLVWPVHLAGHSGFMDTAMNTAFARLTRDLPYSVRGSIEVPADWWEAFKDRWFPAWARHRWPVMWKVYEAKHYLPELPVPADYKQGAVSLWVEQTGEEV